MYYMIHPVQICSEIWRNSHCRVENASVYRRIGPCRFAETEMRASDIAERNPLFLRRRPIWALPIAENKAELLASSYAFFAGIRSVSCVDCRFYMHKLSFPTKTVYLQSRYMSIYIRFYPPAPWKKNYRSTKSIRNTGIARHSIPGHSFVVVLSRLKNYPSAPAEELISSSTTLQLLLPLPLICLRRHRLALLSTA